jgi:hypothetical protein
MRDYFAAASITTAATVINVLLVAGEPSDTPIPQRIAETAYELADAKLVERERRT